MKNIYITWHYTTHGVAYFKHILSEFYRQGLPDKEFFFENLNQKELNLVFDKPKSNGFVFDEIIYLTSPQETFDHISTRRYNYARDIEKDDLIVQLGLDKIYKEIIDNNKVFDQMDKELEFVENNYTNKLNDFKNTIWRNIQHYPVEQQIKWLNELSNFKNVYQQDRFNVIDLNVSDLRNEKEITDKVGEWAKKYFKQDTRYFINVSLGSSETQVAWHILAESGLFPKNTHFIKTYDDKNAGEKTARFKPFSVKEIPVKLISDIGDSFKIFPETKSANRKLADLKMKTFLKSGFSILLMGERGIGKTRIAKKTNMNDKNFITANCASFADDTMAESELFGYEKGAFTGALKEGKSGLFADANGGILFLDEIHNLSKSVQAKLMTALQTEKGGTMNVRKFGSNQSTPVKCRLIFATNRNIEDLKKCLLPDFYDRIVQHVVEMPPLRLSPEERENDWKSTWEYLFSEIQSEMPEVPTKETDPELIIWLTKQPLNGNWRDLEKIAMYYNAYNQFNEETTEMLKEKTAFQYAKNEFEKYHSHIEPDKKNIGFDISSEKSADEMTKDFHFKLYEWAIKKWSRKDAAEKLNVSEKTLNNWKNRK